MKDTADSKTARVAITRAQLQYIQQASGWNYTELAAQLGINGGSVSRLVKGQRSSSRPTSLKVRDLHVVVHRACKMKARNRLKLLVRECAGSHALVTNMVGISAWDLRSYLGKQCVPFKVRWKLQQLSDKEGCMQRITKVVIPTPGQPSLPFDSSPEKDPKCSGSVREEIFHGKEVAAAEAEAVEPSLEQRVAQIVESYKTQVDELSTRVDRQERVIKKLSLLLQSAGDGLELESSLNSD